MLPIGKKEFQKIAERLMLQHTGKQGRHWSQKSIDIAAGVIIDKRRLSDVAKDFGVTYTHVLRVKNRFLARAENHRLEKAASILVSADSALLTPYKSPIRKMLKKGLDTKKIKIALADSGINVSMKSLQDFVKNIKN